MRRILYSLGAICVLAGASLTLPGVASAQPVNQCSGSGTSFQISETAFFQVVPEIFTCTIPIGFGPSTGSVLNFDLLEGPGVVSDYVNVSSNGATSGLSTATVISDPVSGGPRPGATPVIESGVPAEGSDGAFLSGVAGAFNLDVRSDTELDTDLPPVPEPPTGLLMASVGMLPLALAYLGRRGKAKGQPTVV